MRPAVLASALSGAALLAVMVALPWLLPDVPRPLRAAQQAAAEARGQAARYSMMLAALEASLAPDELAAADIGELLSRAGPELEELVRELNAVRSAAAALDRRSGLPARTAPALRVDEAAMRQAVDGLREALRGNRRMLDEALRAAREAAGQAPQQPEVLEVLALLELLRAEQALAEAAAAGRRCEQVAQQWLLHESRRARSDAYRAHYAARDPQPVLGALAAERDELAERLEQARQAHAQLAQRVAARRQELAGLRSELSRLRAAQLELEHTGFTPGDDRSFAAYRQRYEELAAQIAALEAQEQLAAHGGLRDAQIEEPDLLAGPLHGGEPVLPLRELEARLDGAAQTVSRLEAGLAQIDERIAALRGFGELLAADAQRYAEQTAALEEQAAALATELDERAAAAAAAEDAALQAARSAAQAFARLGSAIDTRLREARQAQQQFDPQRRNARLRLILADRLVGQLGPAGQAVAELAVGRAWALRAARLARELHVRRLVAAMRGVEADVAELEQQRTEAGEQGRAVVVSAAERFERLAATAERLAWIAQGGQAAAAMLAARLEPQNAQVHLAAARQALETALRGREQSPYLPETMRRLHAYLAAPQTAPAGP